MSDRWTDRLSEYLDGELTTAERGELETHLAGCAECTSVLEELRQVVARAQALEDRPPSTDLWPGIAERIGAAKPAAAVLELERHRRLKAAAAGRRRFSFSIPQLVAASVALMVLSGGTAWMLSGSGSGRAASAVAEGEAGPAVPTAAARFAGSDYDAAVFELQRIVAEQRDLLDEETVRSIEENLLVIDRAIAEARRALELDPASTYLNEHLVATMQQKLEFLRQAARMAGAAS